MYFHGVHTSIDFMKAIFSVLLFLPALGLAQSVTIEGLVAKQCAWAEDIDPEAGPMAVAEGLGHVAMKVEEELAEGRDDLVAALAAEHPDWDSLAVKREFTIRHTTLLVDSCPHYLALTRVMMPPSPQENATLLRIAAELEAFYDAHGGEGYSELFELGNVELETICTGLGEALKEDFPGGLDDHQTKQAIGMYIMHHVDGYFKGWMMRDILRTVH